MILSEVIVLKNVRHTSRFWSTTGVMSKNQQVSPQLKPGIIIDSAPLFDMHEFINKILRQGSTEYWYCTCQLQIVHTLYKNRAKSTGGNRARFSCSKKYKILIRSSTFHFKLSLVVSPSSFVLLTTFWLFSLNETYMKLFEVTCKRNPELFTFARPD